MSDENKTLHDVKDWSAIVHLALDCNCNGFENTLIQIHLTAVVLHAVQLDLSKTSLIHGRAKQTAIAHSLVHA